MKSQFKVKRAKTRKSKSAKPLVKTITNIVKRVDAAQQETKFCAEVVVPATPLPNTVTTPANLYRMLPQLAQGDQDNERIGLSVDPIYARTVFTFFFNGTSSAASWTQDKIVNLLILKVKGHDSAAGLPSTPAGALLRVGNSQFTDPVYPGGGGEVDMMTHVNHYPINRNLYEVCKHHKFRLRKGTGNQNSAPSATLGEIAPTGVPASEDCHTYVYKWNPPKLRYSGNLQVLPDKHNPVFIAWMTNADASVAAGAIVNVAAFTQMYYKDA